MNNLVRFNRNVAARFNFFYFVSFNLTVIETTIKLLVSLIIYSTKTL